MKLRNIWEGKHNSIHKLIKFRFFQTVAALLWEWRPEYYIKSRGAKGKQGQNVIQCDSFEMEFRETDCQASFDLSPKSAIWLISEKWLFRLNQTAEALFFVTFGRAKPAVDFSTPVYIAVVKLKQNRISKMKSVQDVWADLCKTSNQKLGLGKLGMPRLCSMLPELHWLA